MTGFPEAVDPEVVSRLRVAIGRLNRQLSRTQGTFTFAQTSALITIALRGPIRLGELAAAEHVAAPSMSRTLAGLMDARLVEKRPDPQDGRSCYVVLSPAGQELLDQMRHERSAMIAERVARLTPEQYETLAAAVPVLELLAEEREPIGAGLPKS
jgi:DNA-binding MarR family transcriptional regulator